MKNIYFIILSFIAVLYVFNMVRKKKFSIKESFYWMTGSVIMLILSFFPKFIDGIAKYLGISYPPALLFLLCIIFLFFINLRNSKKIMELQEKVIELGQVVAILKSTKK